MPPDIDFSAIAQKLSRPSRQEDEERDFKPPTTGFWAKPKWAPNDGQHRAIVNACQWYKSRKGRRFSPSREISMGGDTYDRNQIFIIYGWAGTGKTSVVPFIFDEIGVSPSRIAYMTYTGKAALVLSRKIGTPVGTIHSQIYKLIENPVTKEKEVILRHDSPIRDMKLIILDEVSMVNKKIMTDLMSFGIPIICLGDPFQLPPIGGDVFFSDDLQPDIYLTEITRTALDNPVIWFSTNIREGRGVKYGQFGDSERGFVWVGSRKDLDEATFTSADQVICGFNRTRVEWNGWFRKKIGIISDQRDIYPHKGDKLICLKNNYTLGVVNGMMLTALSESTIKQGSRLYFDLTLGEHGVHIPEDYLSLYQYVKQEEESASYEDRQTLLSLLHQYRNESLAQKEQGLIPSPDYSNLADALILPHQECYTGWLMSAAVPDHLKVHWSDLKKVAEIDYGYVISGHKAQGSGWPNVAVLDEPPFRGDENMNARWRYTCSTRTEKNLVWVA